MADASAWLAQLQSQPWYQAVRNEFATRGIPDPVWQATLKVEDGSLNPAVSVVDSNGALSTGLFQLNAAGVGAGYQTSTLQDPVTNARIAAQRMATALTAAGTTGADLPTQLRTIEQAGWNGSLSQDATRQAALADITGSSSSTSTTAPRSWTNLWWLNPLDPNAWAPLTQPAANTVGAQIQTVAVMLTIGAVFLALVAGGFAVLAGGGNAQAPTIIPV